MAILGDSTITTIETTEITVGSDNEQIVLEGKGSLLDLIYPVGSIYVYQKGTTAPTTCPIQNTLGGTWKKIENRFLYSSSDGAFYGKEGGSNQAYLVDHKHTVSNESVIKGTTFGAGSHTHSFVVGSSNWHTGAGGNKDIGNFKDSLGLYWGNYSVTEAPEKDGFRGDPNHPLIGWHGSHTHNYEIDKGALTGTAKDMSTDELDVNKITTNDETSTANMPQYFGVIAWRRTA